MPGIKIGDAVIDLFVNLASLDELESRMGVLPSKAASASTSVSGSLDGIAKSATGAGNQAAVAGEKIAAAGKVGAAGLNVSQDAVQQLQSKIKQLEVELSVLQEKFGQVGPKASSSMREARGTLALLGEDVGIRLPRHLQTFVAGIPGVSGALAAGFAPIAVLTLIDVLDKIPAKIAEIEDWLAGFKQAQKEAFQGQETTFVSQLKTGIELLKEETLQQRAAGKAGIDATKAQIEGLGDYQRELAIAQENLKKFREALDAVNETKVIKPAEIIGRGPHGTPIFSDPEIEKTGQEKLKQEYTKLVEYADSLAREFKIAMPTPTINLEASDKSITEQLTKFNKDISDSLTDFANKQAQSRQEQNKLADEAQKQSLENQAAALKSGLDVQLATLDRFKENVRTAYLSGKADSIDWALAQVRATQEATKAHEDYLVKLEAVYRKAGDSARVQETAEQLRVFQAQAAAKAVGLMNDSIQKETDGISKLKGELADAQVSGFAKNLQQAAAASVVLKDAQEKLVKAEQELATARAHGDAKEQASSQAHLTSVTLEGDAAVKKATKDFDDAAKAAQALANAQRHLEDSALKVAEAEKQISELRIATSFKSQEDEIDRLAKFDIITEQDKERRLKALYEQERKDALSALDQELAQRKQKLEAAQATVEESKNNPIFSESQKKEAEANLNDALAAYERVQLEKSKVDSDYRLKINSLAISERELTAAELALARAKQAGLIQARAQAVASGQDTKDIDKQIDATKKYEAELQRLLTRSASVLRTKPTWDSFFSDLTSRSLRAGEAFKQMASLFADAMASSVEAAVNGSAGFGEAMAQIVKSTLASLAGAAVGHVLTEIAKASSDFATAASLAADPFTAALAPGFIASAHAHLVAAAEWGAIGAGAAVGGAAIPSGGGSYSAGGGDSGGPAAGSTAASSAPQPVQVQNIPHFSSGGFVDKRQLAVIGDSETGGDQAEVIIPLEDESAKRRIAAAFLTAIMASQPGVTSAQRTRIISRAPALSGELANPQIFTAATRQAAAQSVAFANDAKTGPGSGVHYHTYDQRTHTHVHVEMPIQGVISADNLEKVAPKIAAAISKKVKSGEARLTASVSHRVTKRG